MSKKADTQQSVTNATLNLELQNVTKAVTELKDATEQGFKRVHERQDITNGQVGKTKEDIVSLTAKFYYNRLIWYMLTVSISTIVALVSYILFNH